jgi:protein-disulfide isomerase
MKKNYLLFPIVIVVAGVIIASLVLYLRTPVSSNPKVIDESKVQTETIKVRPVDSDDHIIGDLNADIFIVEYSDFECTYCKSFHEVMKRVVNEYGKTGKVAWVYRHFPDQSKHLNAYDLALMSECIKFIKDDDTFWEFANRIFIDSPASTDKASAMVIANELGVKTEIIKECLNREDIKAKVDRDIEDGKKIADKVLGFGTPYSFLISRSGIQTAIEGSKPFDEISQLIDAILAEI